MFYHTKSALDLKTSKLKNNPSPLPAVLIVTKTSAVVSELSSLQKQQHCLTGIWSVQQMDRAAAPRRECSLMQPNRTGSSELYFPRSPRWTSWYFTLTHGNPLMPTKLCVYTHWLYVQVTRYTYCAYMHGGPSHGKTAKKYNLLGWSGSGHISPLNSTTSGVINKSAAHIRSTHNNSAES